MKDRYLNKEIQIFTWHSFLKIQLLILLHTFPLLFQKLSFYTFKFPVLLGQQAAVWTIIKPSLRNEGQKRRQKLRTESELLTGRNFQTPVFLIKYGKYFKNKIPSSLFRKFCWKKITLKFFCPQTKREIGIGLQILQRGQDWTSFKENSLLKGTFLKIIKTNLLLDGLPCTWRNFTKSGLICQQFQNLTKSLWKISISPRRKRIFSHYRYRKRILRN